MTCWTRKGGLYWIDADKLAAHLRRRGLHVVVTPGASSRGAKDSRGRRGFPVRPGTVLAHHTATSNRAAGDYPSMRVVRDGRSGLPGPLAQFGLGRSGTVYIIATGLAWHAGRVGKSSWDNWHAVGIEAEDNGTDKVFPPTEYAAYVRLVAALSEPAGLGVSTILGHKEAAAPRGRKIDPVFSMDKFRRDVAARRKSWGTAGGGVPNPPKSGRVLRLGITGDDVKRLQSELNRVFDDYSKLDKDGSYGYATAAVVREFQRRAKAEGRYKDAVDGITGPNTRKALASYGLHLI